MKIGIIDYDQGNIKSLSNAIRKIGFECNLVNSPNSLSMYDVLFLPGVGAFENAMKNLEGRGFIGPIKTYVSKKKKLIGICLGMQLLFEKSHEFGEFNGLGLIKGIVKPFKDNINLKIPHVGWNSVKDFRNNTRELDFYFVHSFYCKPVNQEDWLFKSSYGIDFCSGVRRNNIIGFQFHPEKSQENGLLLLKELLNE